MTTAIWKSHPVVIMNREDFNYASWREGMYHWRRLNRAVWERWIDEVNRREEDAAER